MTKIRKIFAWVVIVAILTVGVFIILKGKEQKIDYALTPVTRGTLTQTVSANGKYLSKEEANISFRISGQVTDVKVNIGDKVRKGQIMASVDTGTLSDKLQQAKEQVTAQKKILAYQKEKDDLYEKEQRDSQKAVIRGAESVVEEINKQFAYAIIKAPMDGIVAERNINIGEIAQAGNPAFTIIKENEMRIEVKVPEVDIADVEIGQKVGVKFDAYPENKRFEAVITEIDPAPITVQNVVYYVVKMRIENPDAGLKYGMSCTIYDQTNQKDNILIIPKWAIEKEGDKKFVTIMTDTEKKSVERKEVQIGIEGDGGIAEVISGLKDGDQIATEK
ncbi:MAG: efflux RND transporter periplasmic adaptor subunit [Candidatus Moranbacteria bacterium]|nr:efflux RND transporter periplasmic adaptor subunit [Candidatus Moranbacteria bacterium]